MIDVEWIEGRAMGIARAFGIKSIELVQASRNVIYRGRLGERSVALRLPRGTYWSLGEIRSEADFGRFLKEEGRLKVSRPVESLEGDHVVTIEGPKGELLHVTCWEWMEGRSINNEDATPEFFEKVGRLVARFHDAAERYRPRRETELRPLWKDSPLLDVGTIDAMKHPDSLRMAELVNKVIERVDCIEKTDANFGVIHADLHVRNMNLDTEGAFQVFDFDNCERGYFASDLANAILSNLFSPLTRGWRERGVFEEQQQIVIERMIRGYRSVRELGVGSDEFWDFFLLRHAVTYYHYLRDPRFDERPDGLKEEIGAFVRLMEEGKTELVDEAREWVLKMVNGKC
ncbi:MAG: phosphotransferase [Verrucomicrobiota bacterium]